ncbi:MAG: protein translocase subunit SecD [Lachnospiraceae bacterium]|nr:protein translocase subunit SecD [Lachnospiraceae bacterium]
MKEKQKGILSIVLTVVIIAVTGFIAVCGIGSDKLGSMADVKLGLDLAGGVSITYEAVKADPTAQEMEDTFYKMQLRAQDFNSEAAVYREGDKRINVDIPDVTDANEVLEKLGDAGMIYFIYGQSAEGKANIEYSAAAEGYVLTRPLEDIIADGDVVIDGSCISGAEPVIGQNSLGANTYEVSLSLNDAGKAKFADATAYAYNYYNMSTVSVRNIIAIVYDGKVYSAPRVSAHIPDGKAVINGQADYNESKQLASIIRIGALPLELKEIRSTVVGAKLGTEAINTSLLAGVVGFILIILFMVAVYRVPGVAASLALCLYVTVIIICLNLFNVTLTLYGIAGIILSIGMAVDANVVIFTRIREEIGTGKTVRSSIKLGFEKALSAIIDGNVTTLIAAAVLYFLGSGTIKGFAQTLAIGIVLSMGTALFVTKFILRAFYDAGLDKEKFYGIKKETKAFNFTKHGLKYGIVFAAIAVICIVAMLIGKFSSENGNILNYGLDFMGGTSTEIVFEGTAPSNRELEQLVSDTLGVQGEVVQIQGAEAVIIKTEVLETEDKAKLEAALAEKYGVTSQDITSTSISGTVSGEMKSDAVIAVVVATLCMMVYIWVRFKNLGFAASSVLALLHDVIFTLMIYAVARISVGNAFIACMLTLVGYSINATIVVFDRIRENMKDKLKKDTMEEVVNASISQTVSRSINTSLTTFVMVLVLSIFGVSSIREFSIPLMAGIISGTYSSVCLAGTVWYFINKRKKQEA